MISNVDFLKQKGIALSGNIDKDNKYLDKILKYDSKEPIETFYKKDGKKQLVLLDSEDFSRAFCNLVWKNLNLTQRLRVLKWQTEKYLKSVNYKYKMPSFKFFVDFDTNDISFNALALKDKIVFNLDYLSKCSGYSALTTIVHECIHEKDVENCNELIKDYYQYLPIDILLNYQNCKPEILELPLEGKVYNRRTRQYDMVTEKMAEDFLLLKNFAVGINSKKNSPTTKHDVVTKDGFEKYIRRSFYLLSPLEERAYEGSSDYVNRVIILNSKRVPLCVEDISQYQKNKHIKTIIQGKKREIQKYYKIHYTHAINMELINEFNVTNYGEIKDFYLQQDLMEKREKIKENYYNTFFKGNSIETTK